MVSTRVRPWSKTLQRHEDCAACGSQAPSGWVHWEGKEHRGRSVSTAGKLAQHLKQDLRCKDVEYNITKAPLTEQKVKSLVTYLENLKMVENDCVILNLTWNFAPVVSTSTKYKAPVSEGTGRSKKFHLIDLEGRKVCIPNPGSIDILFDKISSHWLHEWFQELSDQPVPTTQVSEPMLCRPFTRPSGRR